MKYLFPIVFILLLANNTFAQDILSLTKKKSRPDSTSFELGIGTAFLSQALFDVDGAVPYMLTSKTIVENTAFRVGVGARYKTIDSDQDAPLVELEDYSFIIRIGVEKRIILTEQWLISIGADIGLGATKETEQTATNINGTRAVTTSIESSMNYHAGMVSGFQYYFNDRVSISAESTLRFMSTNDRTRDTYEANTVLSSETLGDIGAFNLVLPTSIFLVVSF